MLNRKPAPGVTEPGDHDHDHDEKGAEGFGGVSMHDDSAFMPGLAGGYGSTTGLLDGIDPVPFVDIPGNTSTTTTLAVGSSIDSTLETSGDRDWIRIELVAGQSYQFTLNGIGGNALSDPLVKLRDASGTELASNDDGGPGLNSLLSFTATSSGVYYLEARAYSSQTGDYRLSASTVEPPTPADSLDWGSQVSAGAITVYFATSGERFDGETAAQDWTAAEKAAAMQAFGVFSDVTNLTFAETGNQASATFTLLKSDLGGGTLGYFNPPGTANAGVGVFNHTHSSWTAAGLAQGGYAFVTLIHEFGHGLGLAHPHDTGGSSLVMNGVSGSFGSYGDFDLNQGVFTTMSYNDGWATGPDGTSSTFSYGWQGTLGPLDIALMQEKYGANSATNRGKTLYELKDSNASGTMYHAIWDNSGQDTIFYRGTADAVIDLRSATLEYEAGGGGFVSYVTGIIGGFTIAAGVIIERASGGSGNDTLTGNDAANRLIGKGGADTILGQLGDDFIKGGPGADKLGGQGGHDTIFGQGGHDVIRGHGGNDTLIGGGGNDTLFGNGGSDILKGGAGRDQLSGGNGADSFAFGRKGGADTITDFTLGSDSLDLVSLGLVGAGEDASDAFAKLSIVAQGSDTLITLPGGNGSILLKNIAAGALSESDFVFENGVDAKSGFTDVTGGPAFSLDGFEDHSHDRSPAPVDNKLTVMDVLAASEPVITSGAISIVGHDSLDRGDVNIAAESGDIIADLPEGWA